MIRGKNSRREEEHERTKEEEKAVDLENRRLVMLKGCEKKQRLRRAHLDRRERSEAEKLERVEEVLKTKSQEIELAQRLAVELSQRKHSEIQACLKKKRAKSVVRSHSCCTLESIESRSIEEKKREEKVQSAEVRYNDDEFGIAQRHQKKLNYRRELQNQLIDNRRRQREENEEKHRERKAIEEVEALKAKEDAETVERKERLALSLQTEREAFLKARQFWKDKRREVLGREYEEISRIIAEKEVFQKKGIEKKIEIRATKDAVVEKLAKRMKEEERKKIEREEIYYELYVAEKENEMANELIKLALDKKRTVKEFLQDTARHRRVAAERKAKADAIDAAFARYLTEEQRNFAESEELKERARREQIIRYGDELRKTIRKKSMRYSNNIANGQSGDNTDGGDKKEEIVNVVA